MTTKYIQLPTCKLAEFAAAATTSFDVSGFLYNDGVTAVDPADIGDVCFATLEPRTPREELISFTIDSVTAAGVATITAVRGLSQKSPYGTGGAAFDHQNGSDFVISNNPGLFNRLTAKDNEETVTAQWVFPTPTTAGAPVTKSYAEAQFVYKTGAQSIAGVKTFTDKPVVPVATEGGNPIRKDTFDAQTVKLTGAQTVEGVKTFSSSPVVPTASESTDAVNKGQMETYIAANSGDIKASDSAFGTVKLDVAADDPTEPIVIGVNSPINESRRSVDPTDDAGKLVKLESDGKLSEQFVRFGTKLETLEDTSAETQPIPVFMGTDGYIAQASALYDFAPLGFVQPKTVPKSVRQLGTGFIASGNVLSIADVVAPAGENRVIVVTTMVDVNPSDVSWNGISRIQNTAAVSDDGFFLQTSVIPIGDSLVEQTNDLLLPRSGTSSIDRFSVFIFENVDQATPIGANNAASDATGINISITQENTSSIILAVQASSLSPNITDARITTKVSDSTFVVGFGQFNAQVAKTITSSGGTTRRFAAAVELNPIAANALETFVQNGNKISGFSSLTKGSVYYLSDTTGEISATAGTNSYKLGIAVSETDILINI